MSSSKAPSVHGHLVEEQRSAAYFKAAAYLEDVHGYVRAPLAQFGTPHWFTTYKGGTVEGIACDPGSSTMVWVCTEDPLNIQWGVSESCSWAADAIQWHSNFEAAIAAYLLTCPK